MVSAVTTAAVAQTSAASPAPGASPTPPPKPPYNRLAFREIGPAVAGGRVASVAGVADDPRLYYVGSAGGGVWKSIDGAATWTPVFAHENVASIGAVAIDPKHHDTVWVGTGEANPRNDVTWGDGIYKTTDGGKTWKNMGLRETKQIASVVIDPRDPDVVLVGALGDNFADTPERGVFRTADGGKTWTKTLYVGPQSGVSELVADPQNPDVLYAGIWQFQRKPWTFSSGGPQDGIWKSTDGGKTWNRLTGHGLPEGITGRVGLAVAPSDPKRVYALIESKDGILWRSDDAGATWKLMTKNTLVDQRPFYFSHLRVDPSNPDHVYGVSEELSESKDGGKTFTSIAKDVHVDYHDMWIAPNDPKRMMTGEDGGYALTLDGGKNWSFSRNLTIGEIYHVGYDDRTPYSVCVGLQDNNGFCGPSRALEGDGIPDEAWERVVGGDGQWAWPDPRDSNLVWTDWQDGNLTLYDRSAQRSTPVRAWIGRSGETFTPADAKYRFNWDSPIAFDPFRPAVTYFGGNVLFATTDRGVHWNAISPDLSRNDKAHQAAAGGPLALDSTGAETTGTILDIEPSTKTRGELWIGTDDGLVQLSRDGGAHWTNVTPAGVPPFGRVEMVSPSPLRAGAAYAVIDRHYLGDHTPYVFATNDWGAHWTRIGEGLPQQEARAVRADVRNPHLVYLGLENSFWVSYDDGAHWRKPELGLPTVATYDIRIQPRFDDVILATHGRDVFILDDARPLQDLPRAEAAGTMVWAPRTTYAFTMHANDEGLYTRFAGKNPPSGAVISYYQRSASAKTPTIEILDEQGHVIRHIAPTNHVDGKDVPAITNFAGINRATWDLHADGPVRWDGAGKDSFKGPLTGAQVVPGTYVARVTLDGKTFNERFTVEADPRAKLTLAEYRAGYAFAQKHLAEFSQLDAALNRLDAAIASSKEREKGASAPLAAQLAGVRAKALALRDSLTADYTNDEDFIQRPGKLREDLQSLTRSSGGAPNGATVDYATRVDAAYEAAMRDVTAMDREIAAVDAALKAAGKAPLATSGAKRADVIAGE